MVYGGGYKAKVGTIINGTIAATGTWQKIASKDTTIRRWFIKAKNSTDNSFDLAFEDNPSTFLTTDGSGFAFDECSLPNVWVRSDTKSTVIEILTFA